MSGNGNSFVERLRPAVLPGDGIDWLDAVRAEGLTRFAEVGLPTRKVEAWKYTDLKPLEKAELSPAEPVAEGVGEVPSLAAAPAARLVFVDGYLREDLSETGGLPAGVTVRGLAQTLGDEPATVQGRYGTAGGAAMPLAALNSALAADGAVVRIGADVSLAAPIELVFLATGKAPVAYHPHHVIIAERGSRATVIENHAGLGDGRYFANHAAEWVIEEGAELKRVKVQREGTGAVHVAAATADVARGGRFASFVLQTGGALARDELHVALTEEDAEVKLDGAYLGRGKQHIDNTTVIDHLRPETRSNEVYKGVLDDKARAVFQGRIEVRRDAQRIEGHQLNKTLLLSEGAEVDTKPELKIYADDVKCSHGAAAGELDPDQLFYLRARGLPERDARMLLVEAFLQEVVDGAELGDLAGPIGGIVTDWMAQEPGR